MEGDTGINNPHGHLLGVDPKEEEVMSPAISSKANVFEHDQHGYDDRNINAMPYKKIWISGNDQTDVLFEQVYCDEDEVIDFLGGKYLLPRSHPKPCGMRGGEMKVSRGADELGGVGDEVKGGYNVEDKKIAEVSL